MPPKTLYKDIYRLLPGSKVNVEIDKNNGITESINNYSPPPKNPKKSHQTIVKETYDILFEAIQELRPFRKKVAFLLSGGLDSSILFKICQSKDFNIKTTFSAMYPFEDPKKGLERKYALTAAKEFNVKHRLLNITNKDFQIGLIEAILAAEEPIHHLQSVLIYLIIKNFIPKEKKIIINGQGAEVGWGEVFHKRIHRNKKILIKLLSFGPVSIYRKFFNISAKFPYLKKYFKELLNRLIFKLSENFPKNDYRNILWYFGKYGNFEWVSNYFNINKQEIIKNRYNLIKGFNNHSYFDLVSLMGLLGDSDITISIWSKLAESKKKIMYYPYFYPKLINYSFTIPWKIKLSNFKKILVDIAYKLAIPEFIIKRPKSGFSIKTKKWATKGGVLDSLIPTASKIFRRDLIIHLQSENFEKSMTLWNILNYSIWKRLWIENEPASNLLSEIQGE